MVKSTSLKPSVKRDRASRVSSCLPVSINGKAGVTRDISATGIFFEIDEDHEEGSQIHFEVELDTPGGPLMLVCKGKVVRVTKEGGRSAIAAKIISQTLRTA
jgi:hypothetical protein